MTLQDGPTRTVHHRRRGHARALLCVMVHVMALTAGRAQSSPAPQTADTEPIVFSSIAEPPSGRTLLADRADEAWFFISEWSDTIERRKQPAPPVRPQKPDRHRADSPFVVFDKGSRRWSSVGISRHAYAVYPALHDRYNDALIWFGANDGPPRMIIDWAGFQRSGDIDDPLIYSMKPGGLGLIDTQKRSVRYFGPFRDLVSGRVTQLLFDRAAVWAWGRAPGNQELNGIARFDRRTATFVPYPIESKGLDDDWVVTSFTDSGTTMSLVVLEDGEWFNRYEFDKATRLWRTTRYGWVSTKDVPVFERPDDRSRQIDVLSRGMHFGKQGHDHFGHPIVLLRDAAGWQQVMTCRNVTGWIRSGSLADTLSFVRATLRNPATPRDFGNEGPRMFLARVHLYMTRLEAKEAISLFSDPATPANVKGFASRNARGLETADRMWQAFETRRRGLR